MKLPIQKFKKPLILLGVLGGLLVLLGIVQAFNSGKNTRSNATFFGISKPEKLTKIRILGVNGLYENILEKNKDSDWVVSNKGGYAVNPDYVKDLLDIIKTMTRGEIASRNPEKHEDLQVNELGVGIQAWQDDKLVADAIIGKEGPGFTTTYMRHVDSDIVYLSIQNIRPIFNRTDWRDKRVWVFEPTKVTGIEWRYNDIDISLLKTGDGWKQVTPFSKDSSDQVVDPLLAQLTDLFAADIQEAISKKDAGIEGSAQKIRIELAFETGERDALIVGNKLIDVEEYYIGRENSPIVWTIDSYTVEELLKKEIGDF